MKLLTKLLSLTLAALMVFGAVTFASADDPIVLQFWNARGSGQNLEAVTHEVELFNSTIGAEKGIYVEQTYQGGYADVLSKTQLSVSSGDGPQLIQVEHNNVLTMYDDDMLYPLDDFVANDPDFDLNNIFEPLREGHAVFDGQLVSLPYTRSAVIFVYNKGMSEAKGLTPPKTVEELVEWGRAMAEYNEDGTTKVYGFELGNDSVSYLHPMLVQQGSGLVNEDVSACPAVEDGTLLNVLSQWRSWIDEGWCCPFAATDADALMREQFYQGNLGGFYCTTGALGNIMRESAGFGVEVGVTEPVAWGPENLIATGGANIVILKDFCTDEQAAAAWEFVKFLTSDEIQAYEMITTGYAACTYGAAETPELKELLEKYPQYRPGYEAMMNSIVIPGSPNRKAFCDAVKVVCSLLIQEQSIDAEEAVSRIAGEAASILP